MSERRGSGAPPVGAVLVGGESRRMGKDKALLRWRGKTLLEHAVETLARGLDEVVVIGGGEPEYGFAGRRVLADPTPGLGPLGGLDAGFRYAAGRPLFALACDLPRVPSELVELLVAAAGAAGAAGGGPGAGARAWVPRSAGRVQPLCGLYGAGCGELLREYLASGERRAIEFLDRLSTTVVEIGRDHPLYSPGLFSNLNRPADLAALAAVETVAGTDGKR